MSGYCYFTSSNITLLLLFFLTNGLSGNAADQEQEFWTICSVKWHFEERCITRNFAFLIWAIFGAIKMMLGAKWCTWEWWIDVSLYITKLTRSIKKGNVPVHALQAYGAVAPRLVNLSTGWTLVVVFTQTHFSTQYPLNRRLGSVALEWPMTALPGYSHSPVSCVLISLIGLLDRDDEGAVILSNVRSYLLSDTLCPNWS